jgi:quercetin dioxygenase-like cupin family protein
MATKGQTWTDAGTGDKAEMLESANDTGGKYIRFLFTTKPGGVKPAMHLHLFQDEEFEVKSGVLTYVLNNEKKTAKAGEKVLLPKGIGHTHYNDSLTETLVMIQTISPALDGEPLIESLLGLSQDGKMKNGEPDFLQVMVWLRHFKARTYLAKVPVGVQNILAFVLAPVGRLFGYKAVYKQYSGFNA